MKKYLIFISIVTLIYAQNDPYWGDQHWLRAVNIDDFWIHTKNFGNENIIIAILGYGVNINHPDLESNIWVNPNEIPSNSLDDDNNGYKDDINGVNVIDYNGDVLHSNQLENDHETKVAGIIAAKRNNNIYISGIAPNCKILPVKFYKDAQISDSNAVRLIRALEYVKKIQLDNPNNRLIINLSYQFDDFTLIQNKKLMMHLKVVTT